MHHLQELNRKRFLNFQLLTPEEVIPPFQRTFVITKNSYKSITSLNSFVPLIPEQVRPNKGIRTRALSSSASVPSITRKKAIFRSP